MTGPSPYSAYRHPEPRTMPTAQSTDQGLGTKKTMLVLVVVVGCFAVLWPKLFYPMLVNSANQHSKPGPVDKTTGCCDVISELDFETIKIMSQLCSTIIDTTGKPPPTPKEIVIQCKKAVLETCGIDISAAFQDRISLGHSAKQILEEVRSLNGSLCLKYNFGLSPWRLGVPHRVNINLDPDIKQERPAHLRPGMIHPAFRERGRAIPESDATANVPKKTGPPPRIVEGRPGPIPGMRPAMGGPGHVVPPSSKQQANYGFMGVLMPIYTVGFVIFFSYTIMKLVFKKKSPEADAGAPMYPQCEPDEHFYKEVFEPNKHYFNRPNKDNSKIVVNAVAALLEEVNQEIEAKKLKIPQDTSNQQDGIRPNGSLPKEEDQGSVTVMGMETTASSESGKKWSRPDSPVLPHPQPAPPKEPSPPPQQIFLEGALPPQSQILVADSATEAQKDSEDDSPVVLAGKMTLSVISLDSETGTDDSTNSGRKSSDEEHRSSSGNTSEGFEKINAADLEEQINNIIEEAENIALAEERENSPEVELIPLSDEELARAPQINEKDKDSSVLEEIKNQFNLEDDLLQALTEKGLGEKAAMPVTDLIKEFLSSEEGLLLETDDEEKIVEELEAEEIPNLDEAETKITESIGESQQVPEAINLSDLLLEGLLVQPDNEETSDFEPQSDIAEPPTPDTSIKDDSLLEFSDEPTATDADQQQKEVDIEEVDIDEQVEEEEYSDEDEEELEENRESVERRVNGDEEEPSRNGAGNSQTAAENEISEDEDDDEEIEEIIEYVDNTDEEGEEIIEINGNERRHLDGNGENN